MSHRFFFTFQRMLRWKYFFPICLILLIFVGVSLGKEFLRTRDVEKQITFLQSQSDALQSKNLAILEWQNATQTESFIEREARLKLGLKKPGESVVIVKGEEKGNGQGSVGEMKVSESDPLGMVIVDGNAQIELANSTKWWYYFFDQSKFETVSKTSNHAL